MLENKKIVFEAPWEARLQTEALDDNQVPAGHALLKKLYSIISTGTELACLSGGESWFALPGIPGYSCVCEIIKTGPGVEGFAAGDTVFCYGAHTLYEVVPVEGIFLKVPQGIDLKWVPFTRMATIAATATRISSIEWGDTVAVTGQGLVGNMALQLARLQGATTIAVDVAPHRLALAKACGADHVVNSAQEDAGKAIAALTGGAGVETLIEATGVPAVEYEAINWVAKSGEMIFLGSPRGDFAAPLTPFFNRTHLADFNVTLKGAHEWRYPVTRDPFVKHSLQRNSQLVLSLIQAGKLSLESLLTQESHPEDCFDVYRALRDDKDKYMGVLFNWQ